MKRHRPRGPALTAAPVTAAARRTGGSSAPGVVWVLVPLVETTDPNLAHYNDYTQSHAEYARAFAELGYSWRWQPVTTTSYRAAVDAIARTAATHRPVVLNLCDGDEANGAPGLSVLRHLTARGMTFTGADERFYDLTTSKITMKRAFDGAGVPTPAWAVIPERATRLPDLLSRLGAPLIVKPAVSAGSLGITLRSVVHDEAALRAQVRRLRAGYRGWSLASGGVFVERFVSGREFTTFIVGTHTAPERRIVYPPVERVFHAALPATEQFLSFDRLWEFYEDEAPVGPAEDLWTYGAVPPALDAAIREVSWAAYAAVGGTGYGRVDLRMDASTGRLYVLEVNAQCGLSEDENYTSIGAILRVAGVPFSHLVREVIAEALRHELPNTAECA